MDLDEFWFQVAKSSRNRVNDAVSQSIFEGREAWGLVCGCTQIYCNKIQAVIQIARGESPASRES
jgi:hypothetical protein